MISHENCGGSDLTAEHMAEGSNSRTSSSPRDQGYTRLKFDTILTESSKAFARVPRPVPPALISGGSDGVVRGRSMSSPVFALMQVIESERASRGKGGTIMDRTSSTGTPNLGKDWSGKGEDWLELGLGSSYANPRSSSPIHQEELISLQRIEPATLGLWSHEASDREIRENGEFSAVKLDGREPIDSAGRETGRIERPAESHFTYPYIRNTIGHARNSILPLSLISSDQPYLRENGPMFCCATQPEAAARYTIHGYREERDGMEKISGVELFNQNSKLDSKVLQRATGRIQSRTDGSNGDFSWRTPINLGSFVRPLSGPAEIARRTSQASGGSVNGRVEYPRQQFSIYHPAQNVTHFDGQSSSASFHGLQTQVNANCLHKLTGPGPGLWFKLQVAHTQTGERILPQIPKTYIRIKDGTMTISVVKKYLASKLGLKSESEHLLMQHPTNNLLVEISCKGQEVMSFLTIQHVRDAIWFSNLDSHKKSKEDKRTNISSGLISMTNSFDEHLMILHYQRCPNRNS